MSIVVQTITVEALPDYVVSKLCLSDGSFVFGCTNNFDTFKLLSDECVTVV